MRKFVLPVVEVSVAVAVGLVGFSQRGKATLLAASPTATASLPRISPPGGTAISYPVTPQPHIPSAVSTLPAEQLLPRPPFDPARPTGKFPDSGCILTPSPEQLRITPVPRATEPDASPPVPLSIDPKRVCK